RVHLVPHDLALPGDLRLGRAQLDERRTLSVAAREEDAIAVDDRVGGVDAELGVPAQAPELFAGPGLDSGVGLPRTQKDRPAFAPLHGQRGRKTAFPRA